MERDANGYRRKGPGPVDQPCLHVNKIVSAQGQALNASYGNRSTLFLREFMINRRQFISAAAAASTASLWAQQGNEWGGPVLDIHLHLRPDGESNLAHINGSGVTKAVLLTRV